MEKPRIRWRKSSVKITPKEMSRRDKSPVEEILQSAVGFALGLLLASLYGGTVVFVQSYGLRFSVFSTTLLAVLCCFGMGLSQHVRSQGLLMLPMLCSSKGKNFILVLILTLLIQGPMTNTVRNFERAADSVACGADLTINQTRFFMNHAAAPLMGALNKIKDITKSAQSLAGRVQDFADAFIDSIQRIERVLRNVLHFLMNIGMACSKKLGSPYMKCMKISTDARKYCEEKRLMFHKMCSHLDAFQALCNMSQVIPMFCAIPNYISERMKAKISEPTIEAIERLKQQFDFNVTSHINFHTQVNSSLKENSQDIMVEVSNELSNIQWLMGLVGYINLIMLLMMYLKACMYRHRYLYEDDYDNFYITKDFKKIDSKRSSHGISTVLPLTHKEASKYVTPLTFKLTMKEKGAMLVTIVSVLRHLIISCVIVTLDLVVFWMYDIVYHVSHSEIVARVPRVLSVVVTGSGYISTIFRDIVASFDFLQMGNITVISRKCIMKPSEPDFRGYIFIAILYTLGLSAMVGSGYMKRFRRLICAYYYPKREKDRIDFLYQHILTQRASLRKALRRSVARKHADSGQTSLWACIPALACIAQSCGFSRVSCNACGKTAKSAEDPDMYPCKTPQCKGLYCVPCYKNMKKVCPICMGPLIYEEDAEEEIDSSDEEQVALWTSALKNMPDTRKGKKRHRKLTKRIRDILRRKPKTQESQEDHNINTAITLNNPDTDSEPDMSYQERPAF